MNPINSRIIPTYTFFKIAHSFHYSFTGMLASWILVTSSLFAHPSADSTKHWVATWATAPQLVEPGNVPPPPSLNDNSLRQVVRVSIGGDTLRLRISNEFSTSDVTMKSVQIAASTGGNTINLSTNKELTFSGNAEVTMAAGGAVTSDPFAFTLTPRMDVAITIYFGLTSSSFTGHPGSRTTSYIIAGNTTTTTNFAGAVTTDHWYNINAIDVLADTKTACVAILGNSITDGRGSITNMQNRWPDIFSESLLNNPSTQHVGVLNMGIGGNSVLAGGLGPTGVSRYDRDIIGQQGVRWAIVLEGVNDIGGVHSSGAATTTASGLISAYQEMITKAHAANIKIYGATILPFNGSSYYNQYSDACRIAVNEWIRTSGYFDAVIDFDKTMRDPADSSRLVSSNQNDCLHPDAAGYVTMGQSIDLNLFTDADTTTTGVNSLQTIDSYELGQNYPNPFNPGTTFTFDIPSRSFVSLSVFDFLGRKVSTIVSEEMSAGTHSQEWSAVGFPSGVYFYRLQAGPFMETRKLLLIR